MCKFQGHTDLKCRKSWPGDSDWQLPTVTGSGKKCSERARKQASHKDLPRYYLGHGNMESGWEGLIYSQLFPLKLLPGISAALSLMGP